MTRVAQRRTSMQARLDLTKISPAAYKAMAGLEGFVRASSRRCSIW